MQRQPNVYRILSFVEACNETKDYKEFMNIGPTPHNETCTKAGEKNTDSIFECEIYIRQLIRAYGYPPEGCEFFIMENQHEHGVYYDVNIFYKTPKEEDEVYPGPSSTNIFEWSEQEQAWFHNEEYALQVENGVQQWDDGAKLELVDGEHHLYVTLIGDFKKSA